MPATRITVALNAKQSQKAPLLIPASTSADPSSTSAPSIQSLVFKTAQTKLRLKKPTRVYVGGTGQALVTEDDWKTNLRNDVTFLVSAGEDYVGAKREVIRHEDANPSCSIEVLADKAVIDELSITQLTTTAHTLPGIIHAVGQPDLHPGTKFPIGAVFVSRKWIHPPLIGGDIGCGMAWYRTTLSRHQVDGEKGRKVAEKLRGLEGGWRTAGERELWLQDEKGSCAAGEQWDQSIGTIGAGNHFAELQVVERWTPSAGGVGGGEEENQDGNDDGDADADGKDGRAGLLAENEVILLVHSGSRGYGSSILKKHTAGTTATGESQSSFSDDSPQAEQYLEEHDKACRWARANRDLIALRFLSCLEPGEETWQLGQCGSRSEEQIEAGSNVVDEAGITRAKRLLASRKVVDIWHNNVERVRWPPEAPRSSNCAEATTGDRWREDAASSSNKTQTPSSTTPTIDDAREFVYIHRKGAAPTYDPATGLPLTILPLPGSRGTPTIILRPSFSPSTSWGFRNGLSVAHGAGRSMSRAKALFALSQKYKGQNILEPSASSSARADGDGDGAAVGGNGGTWVICDEKDLVYEEAPEAYKRVQDVADDLVNAGAAHVLGWCKARVSYKVRNEAR